MKKILLASTILAGTAGFAAADNANFTFSGKAYMGLAVSIGHTESEAFTGTDFNNDGDTLDVFDLDGDGVLGEANVTTFSPEVSAEFTVGMMTTTDGGLEAGTSITVKAANITMESDHTESKFGLASNGGASLSKAEVYLSGEWGKFVMEYEGANAVNAQFGDVDFEYSYSFGDFDVFAFYEYRFGANNDDFGIKGTYNFSDYSLWAQIEYKQAVSDWEATVGATASMSGFSLAAQAAYDNNTSDWDYKATAGYSMDAYTLGAFIEDDGVDDQIDFGVNASYDLGGGVSVDAAYVYDNDLDVGMGKLGVSMAF